MKWDRLHAIATLCFIGDPLPPAEEYRCRCTRYLEVQIIDSLLRFVQKAREFDLQVADGSLYEHVLWTSESFKIKVWDVVINVAMCTNDLFNPSSYPFIETYTSNIGRDRPMFRQHFNVPRLVASMDATNNQTIECCRTWDLDIVELRRQYPNIHWDRASYRDEIIENENPKKLKVIRFQQVTVQQMLNQTSVATTYLVDLPISSEDVLRHQCFAIRAADRRVHGITRRSQLLNETAQRERDEEDFVRRTLINGGTTRNVRPQLVREGLIRPPLLIDDQESNEGSLDSTNDDESLSVNDEVMDLTEEDDGVVHVQAIDPGTAFARAINPTFMGTHLNTSVQDYATRMEQRINALENRCNTDLTGELSSTQLRSLEDVSLQMRLARIMHPMLDMLTHDIQDYMDQEDAVIDNRLLTAERASLSRMEEQVKAAVLLHGSSPWMNQ